MVRENNNLLGKVAGALLTLSLSFCLSFVICMQGEPEIKVGTWGVDGGSRWDMGRADCIKSIRIRAGGVVDSIAFTYVIGETTKQTHPYGGPGGTSNEIKISDEEYLTSISGYIGECGGTPCISQLTFATNQENYGPYGSGGGTPFNLPVEEGKIARFYGRAGPYLTAIGVYLKPN